MFSSPASPYLKIKRSRLMLFFSLMYSITAFTCSHECCSFALLPLPPPRITTLQLGLACICAASTANWASIPVLIWLALVKSRVPAPTLPHGPLFPLLFMSLQASGHGHLPTPSASTGWHSVGVI